MSLTAMTNRDVVRYTRRSTGITPETNVATPSTVADAADAVVSHIPTEVVAIYIVLTGLVDNGSGRVGTGQWLLLWITLALTPIVTWLLFAIKVRAAGGALPVTPRVWPWASLTLGSLAFLVWAFGLPGTPFGSFDWYRPAIGSAVLLVGSLLIGLVGKLVRGPE
jgi:hypothetical protein